MKYLIHKYVFKIITNKKLKYFTLKYITHTKLNIAFPNKYPISDTKLNILFPAGYSFNLFLFFFERIIHSIYYKSPINFKINFFII